MSKFKHRVEVDGEVVWSKSFDDASSKNIPPEWRGRPEDGEPARHLFIDNECIGVQVSLAEEDRLTLDARQTIDAEEANS